MMTISVLVEFYYFDSFFVLPKFWRKTLMQMNDYFLEKSKWRIFTVSWLFFKKVEIIKRTDARVTRAHVTSILNYDSI